MASSGNEGRSDSGTGTGSSSGRRREHTAGSKQPAKQAPFSVGLSRANGARCSRADFLLFLVPAPPDLVHAPCVAAVCSPHGQWAAAEAAMLCASRLQRSPPLLVRLCARLGRWCLLHDSTQRTASGEHWRRERRARVAAGCRCGCSDSSGCTLAQWLAAKSAYRHLTASRRADDCCVRGEPTRHPAHAAPIIDRWMDGSGVAAGVCNGWM